MADPNRLSRQERRLVDQIHPAKLATEQRLIPRRTGRLGQAAWMSRAMPCGSVASWASWASQGSRLSRSARSASCCSRSAGSARPLPGGAARQKDGCTIDSCPASRGPASSPCCRPRGGVPRHVPHRNSVAACCYGPHLHPLEPAARQGAGLLGDLVQHAPAATLVTLRNVP
jgi:hypothetical protein